MPGVLAPSSAERLGAEALRGEPERAERRLEVEHERGGTAEVHVGVDRDPEPLHDGVRDAPRRDSGIADPSADDGEL